MMILPALSTVHLAAHFPISAILVLVTGFIAAAAIGSLAWFRSERFSGWRQGQGAKGRTSQPGESYDSGITSAATASRQAREGASFKHPPQSEGDSDTTSGYTVDREGILNNYAIEPKMYVGEKQQSE